MKNTFSKIAIVVCAAAIGTAFAQDGAEVPATTAETSSVKDSSFKVSAGFMYRDFKKAKFNTANTGSFTNLLLLNGNAMEPSSVTPSDLGMDRAGVTNCDYISYGGASMSEKGDYGDGEKCGLTLGFGAGLWQQDALSLDFVANFSYFRMDAQATASNLGTFSAANYPTGVGSNSISPLFDDNFRGDAVGSYSATSSFRAKYDMDLYVFDAGLSLSYSFSNGIGLYVSAGPTLSIANIDSTSYTSVSVGGRQNLSGVDSDNDLEFNWGVYLSAGANYWFNDRFGVSAEIRRDEGFGDVGTRYVTQSLDTTGGILKFDVRF